VPDGEPLIVLSHDPDLFPRLPPRAALTVSGHTHGGQLNVPLLRARMVPSRYGDRYARGHVVEGGRHLFVTSGVGTSTHPVRFARPPEIVVLTLRA
jgi:predicted MPP superfamily phosphohydrolase